jgi:hypothetical protein
MPAEDDYGHSLTSSCWFVKIPGTKRWSDGRIMGIQDKFGGLRETSSASLDAEIRQET